MLLGILSCIGCQVRSKMNSVIASDRKRCRHNDGVDRISFTHVSIPNVLVFYLTVDSGVVLETRGQF